MSKNTLTAFTWQRHRDAVTALRKALMDTDSRMKAVDRRSDLFPGERDAQKTELLSKGMEAVRAARAELGNAVADSVAAGRWAEPAPSGETLTRRAYYAQQAANELAGHEPASVLAVVGQVVASGDLERAREYVRASRGMAAQAGLTADWHELEARARSTDEKVHAAFLAAHSAVEASLYWVDRDIDNLTKNLGVTHPDVVAGLMNEPGLDTKVLLLWQHDAEKAALRVYAASMAEQNGEPVPDWASDERPAREV